VIGKLFLSLSISNTDVCWYTFTIFFSFLLNDLISLFTHVDCIKLGGTATKIILVWLLVLMKCMQYCRAFVEFFFPTLLAPPQNIKTSLFYKLVISLFTELTNISVPAFGFTSSQTSKLSLISVLAFAAQFLAWLSPIIRTLCPFISKDLLLNLLTADLLLQLSVSLSLIAFIFNFYLRRLAH
jgi:hypothetical protein